MAIKTKPKLLSVVIVTGNEADTIADCLKSCRFADEIILVATPACTPETIKVAKETNPHLIIHRYLPTAIDFSAWHNFGAGFATSKWQFHLDCDERISPQLQKEIVRIINNPSLSVTNYDIPRANYFLGHRVRYGGTYPDYVKRFFLKKAFHGYSGAVHEQPKIDGDSAVINFDLLHYTHRSLATMLAKSISWTDTEARLLLADNHPPVVWWRFLRMMFTKLWERLVRQQMWRDGTVGWISAIFEAFDTYMIYARLWELQQHD